MAKHLWMNGVKPDRDGVNTVVMYCNRKGCHKVWWPDRKEPKSECKGVTRGNKA